MDALYWTKLSSLQSRQNRAEAFQLLKALLCSSFLRAGTFKLSPPSQRKPSHINFPKPIPSTLPTPGHARHIPPRCFSAKKHLPIIYTSWEEHHRNPLKQTFLQTGDRGSLFSCGLVLFTIRSPPQQPGSHHHPTAALSGPGLVLCPPYTMMSVTAHTSCTCISSVSNPGQTIMGLHITLQLYHGVGFSS